MSRFVRALHLAEDHFDYFKNRQQFDCVKCLKIISDYREVFVQVYVCPSSNVATLWRQKSVGSESERQVPAVVFILGSAVSSDFNNLGLKVPQLILPHFNKGMTFFYSLLCR